MRKQGCLPIVSKENQNFMACGVYFYLVSALQLQKQNNLDFFLCNYCRRASRLWMPMPQNNATYIVACKAVTSGSFLMQQRKNAPLMQVSVSGQTRSPLQRALRKRHQRHQRRQRYMGTQRVRRHRQQWRRRLYMRLDPQ